MRKIVVSICIGIVFISGCSMRSSILVGSSVCKPEAFSDKKITIDCDAESLKASLTEYFMNADWAVFDGPYFKTAEYVFTESNASSRANASASSGLVFGGRSDSATSYDHSKKTTTNGEYNLRSNLLLRADLVNNDVQMKIIDYKTQEVLLFCVIPYDGYTFSYLELAFMLHKENKTKHIIMQEIIKDDKTDELVGLNLTADGFLKKYYYDAGTGYFKPMTGKR